MLTTKCSRLPTLKHTLNQSPKLISMLMCKHAKVNQQGSNTSYPLPIAMEAKKEENIFVEPKLPLPKV